MPRGKKSTAVDASVDTDVFVSVKYNLNTGRMDISKNNPGLPIQFADLTLMVNYLCCSKYPTEVGYKLTIVGLNPDSIIDESNEKFHFIKAKASYWETILSLRQMIADINAQLSLQCGKSVTWTTAKAKILVKRMPEKPIQTEG